MVTFPGIDTGDLLVKAMRTAEVNHRVLANNIANVDTPGYSPKRLDFQKTLRSLVEERGNVSLRKTLPRHLDAGEDRPEFERLAILSKNDYNKVDLDEEMALLSENTGKYTTYGSLLVKRFEQMKNMLTNLR